MSKYLGKDFTHFTSYGHVRDLVSGQGAVDDRQRLRDEVSAHRKTRSTWMRSEWAMKQADGL